MEKKMKAMVIHGYGDSNVLTQEQVDIPELKPDEVLIKVHYTSVNPVDWKMRSGLLKDHMPLKFPAILGIDVAGTIEKTGSDSKKFKVGDKVFCRADVSNGGSYSEYVAVNEDNVAHAPESISLKETAALPVTAGTAWSSLFDTANLKSGQKVLITGASGGVGIMAVQFAKKAGAYVICTTSKPNIELLKSLGADEVIDYTEGDFSLKVSNVDVVLDTVGGETLQKAHTVLKKGGILVAIAGQPDISLAEKHGIKAIRLSVQTDGKKLGEIARAIDEGKLKVVIYKEFPLERIAEAHDLSESRKAVGKIVVTVSE